MINKFCRALLIIIILLLCGCSTANQNNSFSNDVEIIKEDCVEPDGTIDIYVYGTCEKLDTTESSWIESVQYYSQSKHLIVHTRDGNEYVHANISSDIWNEFKSASSYGSYYSNNLVRNEKYWVVGYDGNNGDKIQIHYEY